MFGFKICRAKNRAFTLLEVIAAISLFAFMMMGVITTLKNLGSITNKIKDRQGSVLTGVMAIEKLRRDFSMAYSETHRKSMTAFKLREMGQGPEVVFATLDTPVRKLFVRRTPGIIFVKYSLEKDDNGTLKLLRREAPLYDLEKIDTIAPQLIATGILKMEIEGYDAANDQWKKEWDSTQPGTNGFPKAVHLVIECVDPSTPKEEWKAKTLRLETRTLVLNQVDS